MEAIILAGGLGTRLRAVTNGLPKPMAPIDSEPFLAVLLDSLLQQGVDRVILSVGYKADLIQAHFGNRYRTCQLVYSVETEPLGTGGAIRQALEVAKDEQVFAVNGDTLFRVPLLAMMRFHQEYQADLSLALKPMSDFDRYGNVVLSDTRIVKFEEKQYCSQGNINGGIYLIQRNLIERFGFPSKFSFETDFLQPCVNQLKVHGFVHDAYFIDIGIPEDYQRAQQELKNNSMRKALFLDRDGVINHEYGYVYRIEDFNFINGIFETCAFFQKQGYLLVVITNQAGIARGYYSEADFHALNRWMLKQFSDRSTEIAQTYYCPNHPTHGIGQYLQDCCDRKPKPGMILQAQQDWNLDLSSSILVGDKESDIQAGLAAQVGLNVLVRSGHSIDELSTQADAIVDSIRDLPGLLSISAPSNSILTKLL